MEEELGYDVVKKLGLKKIPYEKLNLHISLKDDEELPYKKNGISQNGISRSKLTKSLFIIILIIISAHNKHFFHVYDNSAYLINLFVLFHILD